MMKKLITNTILYKNTQMRLHLGDIGQSRILVGIMRVDFKGIFMKCYFLLNNLTIARTLEITSKLININFGFCRMIKIDSSLMKTSMQNQSMLFLNQVKLWTLNLIGLLAGWVFYYELKLFIYSIWIDKSLNILACNKVNYR